MQRYSGIAACEKIERFSSITTVETNIALDYFAGASNQILLAAAAALSQLPKQVL
jgi:hypothetical protein